MKLSKAVFPSQLVTFATLLLCGLLLAGCAAPATPQAADSGQAEAQPTTAPMTPTSLAASTTPAAAAALETLPPPASTPGTEADAQCGAYTLTQHVKDVMGAGQVTEISIADAQGQQVKTIALDTTQGGMVGITKATCGDLTGDGTPELSIESFTGGANCCFVYDIYTLAADVPLLWHWDSRKGGVKEFALLSGQPPYEIVGGDDRLAALADLPTLAVPVLPVVFAFRDGQYVRATTHYPQILQADAAEAEQGLAGCNQDLLCEKSQALHLYAIGVWQGQGDQVLAKLKALVTPPVYTWLESKRAEVADLLAQ